MKDLKIINVGVVCPDCEVTSKIPTLLSTVRCKECGKNLRLSEMYKQHIVEYYRRLGIYERQKDAIKFSSV